MQKTKFSVVISEMSNDKYAVVLKAWTLDEEGKKVEKHSLTKAGIDIDVAHQLAIDFVDKNKEVEDGK